MSHRSCVTNHLGVEVCINFACQRLKRATGPFIQLGAAKPIRKDRRVTHLARRYALPYHPTSGNEWKSLVIRGIAYTSCQLDPEAMSRCLLTVAIIATSSIARKNVMVKELMIMASLRPVIY